MSQDITRHVSNVSARRILVVGVTGTGKTHLAKKLVQKCPRLIVVDPLCEWSDTAVICSDWEAVFQEVVKDRFRISVEIDESPREILNTACRIARDEEVGNCFLVVDELSLFFRRGEEAPESIQGVVRFGRRENVSLLLISQRSYDCPIDLRSQLSDIYAFRSHEPRDIQHLGQIVGREEAQRVLALRGHNYYHWNLSESHSPAPELDGDSETDQQQESDDSTENELKGTLVNVDDE